MVSGPLVGVKVIEVGGIGPGPFTGMMLSDMGAEVIRIDRPDGDLLGPPDHRHNTLHRGRRSVALDLRDPQGLGTLLTLVAAADVVLECYRPGVAERLGFGPDVCARLNPKIVYARMTGWGQEGPLAQCAGHDIGYIALTGALHAIGPTAAPAIPLNLLGDFGGGATFCVIGILAALHSARENGTGQIVDAAITDGTSLLTTGIRQMVLGGLWDDRRGENLMDGGRPWYATYETADGRHMAVGALEQKFYDRLLAILDLSGTPLSRDNPSHWPALRETLAARFAEHTLAHWTEIFSGTDACTAPVLTFEEATSDPHLVARNTFVDVEGVLQPAPAPRFSGTPAQVQGPPTRAGVHTREVLESWGVANVDSLLSSGAAVQTS